MPGTRPMRRTTMRRRLLPVSTFTALLMVMFSRLTLFTSVILSPTHSPACSAGHTRLSGHPVRTGTSAPWWGSQGHRGRPNPGKDQSMEHPGCGSDPHGDVGPY
uniref:Uncharacterized protein n=1 Tax=Nothoprocta perdicaria TaxID=30464 RepID=A0A8C6ZN11_NOTPE